jgi:hypothetical protein
MKQKKKKYTKVPAQGPDERKYTVWPLQVINTVNMLMKSYAFKETEASRKIPGPRQLIRPPPHVTKRR